MSIIFGLWGRGRRPIAREDLDRMLQANAGLPRDGSDLWHVDDVGFGLVQRYNTPESPHEAFPWHSTCGRYAIASYARLDNRDELLQLFAVPRERVSFTPDTALLALAYERWGESFVERLAGDWACAVWSRHGRRLFLAVAPTGNCALFYNDEGPCFAFSSTPHALLALPWISRTPDYHALGLFLLGASTETADSGFFRSVRALPQAHLLIAEPGRIEIRAYWRPKRTATLRAGSDGEYLEAFLEKYRRAVTCRLRSYQGVGATLSGGLDSGSVVALAAEARQSKGLSLPAFSSVPRFGAEIEGCTPPHRCGDETPYILATAETAGNVEVNLLRSEETTPVAGIRVLTETCCAPIFGAMNCFWMHDLLMHMRQQDLRVLLTGQGGNGTVSWAGSGYCWDYLDGPPSGRSLRVMARWLRGLGFIPACKTLLRGLLPSPVLLFLGRLRGKASPVQGFMDSSPLHREFVASLGMDSHFRNGNRLLLRGSRMMRQILIEQTCIHAGRYWYLTGAAHGIDVRDPTMDKGLIEFLLSIPEDQYHRGHESRRLIRRSMAHLLPGKVLHPEKRGLQAADIIFRIRDSREEVFETLSALEQHAPAREVLNLEAMRTVAERALVEVSPELTLLCGSMLCRGLSAGLFLWRHA